MEYHLIHALVLTPFESSLAPLEWEEIATTDFAVHALFCEESAQLLFHSDSLKNDCANEISKIKQTLEKTNNRVALIKQIIILGDNEDSYNAQDVIKHFH